MKLDRQRLRQQIHTLYREEHEQLGDDGTLRLLEKSEQWDLSATLSAGGVIVFPHAGVADCGHQIAAAVRACLDSGSDRVVVVSVLHAFTDEMEQARIDVAAGKPPADYEFWGIQGPGITGRSEWLNDHALYSFRHFWKAETQRREIEGPEVFERYPYLAGGKPELLPGMEELQRLAKEAVIVSTADPFHHGIGYGDPPDGSFHPDREGLTLARARISEGMALLAEGDYWGYNQHCVEAKSDARDAGQVFRYLSGPLNGTILDVAVTDATDLYGAAAPTWVAGALIDWKPVA